MNKYNKAMQLRVNNVSKALAQLESIGCAIYSLSIDDKGSFIGILPPPNKTARRKLGGQQVSVRGDIHGRCYHWQARIHGCNVRWQSTPTLQTN